MPKPIYETFALFPGLRQTFDLRWINGVKPTVTKKLLNGRSRGRPAGALPSPLASRVNAAPAFRWLFIRQQLVAGSPLSFPARQSLPVCHLRVDMRQILPACPIAALGLGDDSTHRVQAKTGFPGNLPKRRMVS